MTKLLALAAAAFVSAAPLVALAEPTHVMVRAQALDAKFIGDHMGGVRIRLKDARTGAVLAEGLTKGGTGDTQRIVRAPRARGDSVTDTATAGFEAVLDLKRPTLVRAEATGPMGKPGASIVVTSSLWIVPGRDILGDGWTLTLPGLVVEPSAATTSDGAVAITAKVAPMCGCPIEKDGLWDAANYRVEARLMKGRDLIAKAQLTFTGRTGEYAATVPKVAPGRYALSVVATDAKTINAGFAERKITLRDPR
ncbi:MULTISPECIES: hypothetical protein [unclassified Caulobacter]|uniref:hypothetical protein n=1 Tax=unclassified Caulobacter TaxID=2648921 RepID=UPI0012E3F3A6|nr:MULTISPECIES: hypothetical protein [unclassified Caulobacter]